jgi:hypothetical protein
MLSRAFPNDELPAACVRGARVLLHGSQACWVICTGDVAYATAQLRDLVRHYDQHDASPGRPLAAAGGGHSAAGRWALDPRPGVTRALARAMLSRLESAEYLSEVEGCLAAQREAASTADDEQQRRHRGQRRSESPEGGGGGGGGLADNSGVAGGALAAVREPQLVDVLLCEGDLARTQQPPSPRQPTRR